ncbi:MAG: RagB/SusD family nutrient uptake outer membrane protein, partial [Ruminococcus flavefaciens]|nr:RagB/SusD family nutrient uptake outer membrane protein [Ruminococcus flavefaciens]
MKSNIFVKGILGLMVAAGMASCSSDYLELEPITNIDETKMFENVDNAQRALWGVCRSMYMGYTTGENIQFMNGESWINTMYGEVYGSDAFYYRWQLYGTDFMKGNYLRQANYWMPQMPWMYSYNLIVQCNRIIENIDNCEGTEDERKYVKAQALTIRAHAYTKLLQYFGPRFEESNNGEALVCPLRLKYGTEDLPMASFKDVMTQIYNDLDV